MSDEKDREALKKQLEGWIHAARHDDEVRSLFRELIDVVQQGSKPQKTRKRQEEPEVNPFEVLRENGKQGLEKKLAELDASGLVQIIKHYGLDPSRKSHKWKDPDRLKSMIVERVYDKSVQGDVFSR